MKRSRLIVLTMAGVSLGSTGCRRDSSSASSYPRELTPILNPAALNPQLRQSLPAYQPGVSAAGSQIPHNAYDPSLGYYHQPCSAWFPYPYDYHDRRWGWYRCGKWSRHSASTPYRHSSGYTYYRPNPQSTSQPDYTQQPAGAPQHEGVPHSAAERVRSQNAGRPWIHSDAGSSAVSRGGFGSTGHGSSGFSSFFSGS